MCSKFGDAKRNRLNGQKLARQRMWKKERIQARNKELPN
jgi:hypothetical protein